MKTYAGLVGAIKEVIATGRQRVARAQAETYWTVGKFIADYVLEGADRAQYGEHIYEHLSRDLKIHLDTLEKAVRFSRKFSISDARLKLTWSHFRSILTLPDSSHREFVQKAVEKKWTSRQLQKEIVARKAILYIPSQGPVAKLKVTRGKLYTYRIDETTYMNGTSEKSLDLGFDAGRQISAVQQAKFKGGDVVEALKVGKGLNDYRIRSSGRTPKDLYMYRAVIERIVDGDTAIVYVDLGFGVWHHRYLRFRGINCPELSTKEGQAVKRFITERIKPNDFIVIKTHKDDKYGRYLVDVFYLPGEKDPTKVAAEGIYLNQELLDNRLAVVMKG